MKKVFLILFAMGLFSTGFTSCRDTKKDEPIEEAADEVQDAADEVEDEM